MGLSATQIARIQSRINEQRLSARRRLAQPLPIELLPGKTALLQDLSEGGFSVSGIADVETGTATYIHFQFAETNSLIHASGVVAWSDSSGKAGVRFTRIEPDSTAALRQWLKSDDTLPEMKPAELATQDSELAKSIACLQEVSDLQALISSEQLDTAAALDLIARRMMELTRATGAAIALREGEDVVCRASVGNAPDVGIRLSPTSLSGECFRTGATVLLNDSDTDPRVNPEICRQLNFRSLAVIPVMSGEQSAGIAEVLSPHPRNFQGADVLVMSFLADLVASIAAPVVENTQGIAGDLEAAAMEPAIAQTEDADVRLADTVVNIPAKEIKEPAEEPVAEPIAAATMAKSEAAITQPAHEIVPTEPAILEPDPIATRIPVPVPSAKSARARSTFPTGVATAAPAVFAPSPVKTRTVTEATETKLPRNAVIVAAAAVAILILAGVITLSFRGSRAKKPQVVPTPSVAVVAPSANAVAASSSATNNAPEARTLAPTRSQASPSSRVSTKPEKRAASTTPVDEVEIKHNGGIRPSSPAESAPPQAPTVDQALGRSPAFPASIIAPVATASEAVPIQSKGVVQGKLLRKVAPRYPEMARRAGVAGDVVLTGTIGIDGTLHDLKVVSGSPLLQSEAIAAAKQWRYSPYLLDGKAIETETRITISFHR